MIKKYTIIILTLFFFTVLNLAPLLMVKCTETDGSRHLENIFNRCCSSAMLYKEYKRTGDKSVSISLSHCLCSNNFTSQYYIISKYNIPLFSTSFALNNKTKEDYLLRNNNHPILTSESPPISISLVKNTILLI